MEHIIFCFKEVPVQLFGMSGWPHCGSPADWLCRPWQHRSRTSRRRPPGIVVALPGGHFSASERHQGLERIHNAMIHCWLSCKQLNKNNHLNDDCHSKLKTVAKKCPSWSAAEVPPRETKASNAWNPIWCWDNLMVRSVDHLKSKKSGPDVVCFFFWNKTQLADSDDSDFQSIQHCVKLSPLTQLSPTSKFPVATAVLTARPSWRFSKQQAWLWTQHWTIWKRKSEKNDLSLTWMFKFLLLGSGGSNMEKTGRLLFKASKKGRKMVDRSDASPWKSREDPTAHDAIQQDTNSATLLDCCQQQAMEALCHAKNDLFGQRWTKTSPTKCAKCG